MKTVVFALILTACLETGLTGQSFEAAFLAQISSRLATLALAAQTITITQAGPVTTADSVTPNAGSGNAQVFTASFSNTAGSGDLASEQILINSALSNSRGCSIFVNSAGFYLFDDAGSILAGPARSGTLSNSQCTLSALGSSVSNTGYTRTVTVALSFTQSFAGAKTIFLFGTDISNNNSGFQNRGAYTVANLVTTPTVDSILPNSASGSAQTIVATFSDANGYTHLASEQLLINSALSNTNACSLYVNANGFYLFNDTGTNLIGPATQGGSLSNSQCTFLQAGSSATGSGASRVVTANLSFKPAFVGAKSIFGYTANEASNSGFQNRGTYTVLPLTTTPLAVSVLPNATSGTGQTFSATYSDSGGYTNLASEQLLINSALSNVNACSLYVNSSGFFLFNDAGTNLLGPAPAGGSLTNSQCTLAMNGSSVSNSGTNKTVTFNLSFTTSFSGAKYLYSYVTNVYNNNSGFQNRGSYTVARPSTPPSSDSVSPNSGSGLTQAFTAVYSDASGSGNLASEQFLINSVLSNSNACSLYVNSSGFYLFNDAGNSLLGPATPGGTLANRQCIFSQAGSSVVDSGYSRTVTYNLTFTAAFSGTKGLYAYTTNSSNYNSGFQNRGSYSVPLLGNSPTADSVSPASSSGSNQLFSVVYSDANGYTNLSSEQLIINSSLSNTNACSLYVNSSGFYLFNDAGTSLFGPAPQSGTLSNGQCTFSLAGSLISGAGNSRTVVFNLSFSSAFAGQKSIYAYATNASNHNSGFQGRGTFIIPIGPTTPTADSISPSVGAGSTQSFSAVYSDANGFGNLTSEQLLINSSLSNTGACSLYVNSAGFYLFNDAGTNLTGPLPQNGALSNSQCTLSQAGSVAIGSGSSRLVVFNLHFAASFAGQKSIYLYDSNSSGNNSGFQNRGSFLVQ